MGTTIKMTNEISQDLQANLLELNRRFNSAPDLVVRVLQSPRLERQIALIYMDGLTDKAIIHTYMVKPVLESGDIDMMESTAPFLVQTSTLDELESALLNGFSVVLEAGSNVARMMNAQGWPERAIEEPQLEATLKGAHLGFTETYSQNIAMIRRYVANRELNIEEVTIGDRVQTKIAVISIGDIANPELLEELKGRISRIQVDSVLNTGMLIEWIEDNPYSPFPQFLMTERPDVTASELLQGRFCVVVDRSPSVVIGPSTMNAFFQSTDDFGTRWIVASFIRILRFLGLLMALFLPSIYIAIISFNYEIIPLELLLTIGEVRGSVPFPPFIEALIMEITLEMLREAGIRLPSPIGQTVGIVGGIVLGQTAVQAGIVSNLMVIVVAFTAIATFIIPSYDMGAAIRFIRFPMMIISAMFGITGIVIGAMILIGHLISLESLGTPYSSPLMPIRIADWKDSIIRLPIWLLKKRPQSVPAQQGVRMGDHNREEGNA
ncbi:spore germination protein [Paenibacillus sp. PL2-23]|uniref:spore germination protein n=1 Tax=Paenibacillus sp. PL2-23 TaxID=2100729 RepID=UPI0030FC467A